MATNNSLIILLALGVILLSVLAKLMFWKKRNTNSFQKFVRSFLKLYGKNRIYDASSEGRRRFLRASNAINIIWWTIIFILLIVYIYANK